MSFPWSRARLLRGTPVLVSDLDLLPPSAAVDRDFLETLDLRSIALIPVESGDLSSGLFAMWTTKRRCQWSSSLPHHCRMLGSMLLAAHARKVTGLEREDSYRHFREIFRNASVGMALEETSGRMLFVNESLCQMLGLTETGLMRKRCVDISHPADEEREAILFQQLMDGERKSYQIEKRFFHEDGSIVWGRVNVTLLREYANSTRIVLAIVEDITAQKATQEKLNVSQKEVQTLASRLILSQEDERQSLARELHDDISQRLSLVTSEMHTFKEGLIGHDSSQLASLEDLSRALDVLVTDVHGLSHRLHSSKLVHLGIVSALRELCCQMKRSGLPLEVELGDNLDPVPKDIALCLYRVAQEALTNSLKHSGAKRVVVSLTKTCEEYAMVICDTGKGFDVEASQQGLGLISMRERLRSLHGEFCLVSAPGRGTRVTARVPREDHFVLSGSGTA